MLFPTEFEWKFVSSDLPGINRPCGRCGAVTIFASTGKFRLNANGARLDAWLIYACTSCGKRWNRTIFERRSVNCLDHGFLEALQQNDAVLASRLAREIDDAALEAGNRGYALERRFRNDGNREPDTVVLTIRNPLRLHVRLDQVLATGLDLPRRKVLELTGRDILYLAAPSAKALKRRVPEVIHLVNTLSGIGIWPGLLERLSSSEKTENSSAPLERGSFQ